MSTPPNPYTRKTNFTSAQQGNPAVPPSATSLDQEFNAVKATLDGIMSRLAQVQRTDGSVANASVGYDQLTAQVTVTGIKAPVAWAAATQYNVLDTVINANVWYWCSTAHLSGVSFDATKFNVIFDFTTLAGLNTAAAASATAAALSASTAANYAGAIVGTSTTSLSIPGIGVARVFVTQANKQFQVGTFVQATSASAPANFIHGQVTAYAGTSLTITSDAVGGAGTFIDWNISIAGLPGNPGAAGAVGAAGATGPTGATGASTSQLQSYLYG